MMASQHRLQLCWAQEFDKYLCSKAYISKVLSSLLILLRVDGLPHVKD